MILFRTAFAAAVICVTAVPCISKQKSNEDKKITVETHRSETTVWHNEKAITVDGIAGFKPGKEPKTDKYGGWYTADLEATGFFRVQKHDGRWWMVTPEGHPFICMAVACLNSGSSEYQRAKRDEIFGSKDKWAAKEIPALKACGFNAAGAWSDTDFMLGSKEKIPYCVIISPLKKYERKHYRNIKDSRFAMVFGQELEEAVKKEMKIAAQYKDDPWCIGYFIDNEIPWRADNLDLYLNELPETDPNHIAAVHWLNGRKANELNWREREEFAAYLLDSYLAMATKYLREQDSNHMFLGCRFCNWKDELRNKPLFEVAGKYMDIVSINHYSYWEPWYRRFDKWEEWSGRPNMVTEFYTKGESSGLENKSGAGWIVKTQKDRGLFYQNFVINLMKSRSCVGWQYFKYQDNDPTNLKADPSNRNSNKGLVNNDFVWYKEMADEMKKVNRQARNIIRHYMKAPAKPVISLIDDDFRKGKVEEFKHILDSLDIKASFAIIPEEKDGKSVYSLWQRNLMKHWHYEGHTFVIHPPHKGWYDSPSAGPVRPVEECEKCLEQTIKAFGRAYSRNTCETLVYPGSSGKNPEIVNMAGKHVRYGIGARENGPLDGSPIQIYRLFLYPDANRVDTYKKQIRETLEKDGFIILGMHSWQFDRNTYPILVDILTYAKTLAEFKPVSDALTVFK